MNDFAASGAIEIAAAIKAGSRDCEGNRLLDVRPHRAPQSQAWRLHRRCRRAGACKKRWRSILRARVAKPLGRSPARRSRSRTCLISKGWRPARAQRSIATRPPAKADATLIERLEAAGAILVGALNMGEYAYDFTGQNVHDGPSRNPHDLAHMSGGSSGGSGAAVARRACAARARLRHQRLDPRAGLVVRRFRPQADLRPPLARQDVSVRGEPRSPRSVRPQRRATSRRVTM